MIAALSFALGFLCGSVPFGYLLARHVGQRDVRQVGSGNIGATNVARILGAKGWAATVLLDGGKGALGALAAGWLFGGDVAAAAGGLGAIFGHCFTPWLGWRGGKGVATMFGAFLVVAPAAAGVAVAPFVVVIALTRLAAVASLSATTALLIATLTLDVVPAVTLCAAATAVLVFVRHRDNLGRLLRGEEDRMQLKREDA